jgi:hypothetical protein
VEVQPPLQLVVVVEKRRRRSCHWDCRN